MHAATTQPRFGGRLQCLTRRLCDTALDLVFPAQCVGCGMVGSLFCPFCQESLHTSRQILHTTAPNLDGLYTAGEFKDLWRDAIHAFKYEGQQKLIDVFAVLLPAPPEADATALVVPVPLHPNRQRWRGYNQATLLAEALAARRSAALADGALTRVRDTRPQVGLDAKARRKNVEDAFHAEPSLVAGREVILVDDVFTTGATLSAGAAALRQAGATAVWGVTLACAPKQS